MLSGILHALGVIELFDRLRKLIPDERIVEGGRGLYKKLDERFQLAAREKFWPWVLTDFKTRDPAGYDLLFARQRERHEWQGSEGAFNALSETYMNVALGRVFEQETDPENRFRIFGDVARMDDAGFAAWLDAVTDDGFEQYFAHVRHLAVHLWWPEAQRLRAYADRALRTTLVAVGIFFVVFVVAETSGWDLFHVFLAIFVVAGIGVAFWQWPAVVVALSGPEQTRKVFEPVAAGFAAATLLIVVGMFVPTHLAPWKMQVLALVSLPGLGVAAYWGFLKGMTSPLFTPKTVGFVFASVLLVTAFWAFNEKYEGGMTDTLDSLVNRAEAAVDDALPSPQATEHPVGVCDSAIAEVRSSELVVVDARHDCWSEYIVIPGDFTTFKVRSNGACLERFFVNSTGDTAIGGDRGFIFACGEPSGDQLGPLRVRPQQGFSEVHVVINY